MRTSNVHEFAGILEDFVSPAIEASADVPAPNHARRVREAAAAMRSLAAERDEALDVLRRLVDALPLPDPLSDDPEAVARREAIALLERHVGAPASPEAAKCLCTAPSGWWECPVHAQHGGSK